MPYRAPGLGDDRLDWILVEVRQAQATLDARIADAQALPDTEPSKAKRIARLNQMKREVDNAFIRLDSRMRLWAKRDVSAFYQRGHQTAAAQLSAGFDFTLPHREALDIISFDAYDDVATRLLQVRSGFGSTVELQKMFEGLDASQISTIQGAGRSAVTQALLTGEDPRKIAKLFAQDLWADGISIVDSGGRHWNPETYTRMLIRTKSANAYNAGSMNKYAEEGVSRVRVFDGVEDDQECAEANGQIWSLDYAMEHVLQHPNCRRAFAPEQGEGPVDRKRRPSAIVTFDRVEAGAVAIAALRSFRRTGEINVSSTLARLVVEFLEIQAGVGLPIVDQFVMGALGQGFRNADAWVEAYIDPVLFAAGLIDEIPNRAQMVRMSNPSELVKSLERSVAKTADRYFPRDGRLIGVVNTLDNIAGQAQAGLAQINVNFQGGLKWADWTSAGLISSHRFGQITGETLLVVKNGEIDNLKQAWREAADYVDQMALIRSDHQALLRASHEEAAALMQNIGSARHSIAEILETEDLARIDDELSAFLSEFNLDPTLRHLQLLDDELTQVQFSAYNRVQQTRHLAKAKDHRALPFPASAGPDFLSEAGTYWDDVEFEDSVALFNRMLADIGAVPEHDISLFRETGEVIRKLADNKEAREFLTGGLLNKEGTLSATANFLHQEVHGRYFRELLAEGIIKEADPDFLDVEKYLDFIADIIHRVDFDGTAVTYDGVRLIDDTEGLGNLLSEAIIQTDKMFVNGFVLEGRWPHLMEPLMRRTPDGNMSDFNILWQRSIRQIVFEEPIWVVKELDDSTIGKVLSSHFDDVQSIPSGINTTYIVGLPTGEHLFIKEFTGGFAGRHVGGVQGQAKGAGSQILTSWVAREFGEIEAPPTQIWHFGDGKFWGVAHPVLDDSDTISAVGYTMRDDQARRHALLDLLTNEFDGHSENMMVDIYNDTVFSIDSEAGFYHAGRSKWVTNKAGSERQEAFEGAWGILDDITAEGNDPPVSFFKLTIDEYESILDVSPTGFSNIQSNLQLPVLQSSDGDHYLIAGRMGQLSFDDINVDVHWYPSFYLTDSELDFVLRDDHAARMLDEIKRLTDDLPDRVKREMTDSWVVGDFEELQRRLADDAAAGMVERVQEGIDQGLINVTGGIQEYVSPTGVRAVIGEPLTWSDEFGPGFGTVVNIIEDTNGDQIAVVAKNVGFSQSAAQLDDLGGASMVRLNLSTDLVVPSDFVPEVNFAQGIRRTLGADPVSVGAKDTFVSYESVNGVFIPVRSAYIQLDNQINQEITHFYRLGKVRTNYRFEETIQRELLEIIKTETNKLSGHHRPSQVVLSSRVFENADGKRAFGMFDADERILYISATGLFPNVSPNEGRLVFDSLDALNESVDFEHFTRVLQHELGHSRDVGNELLARADLNAAVWDQLLSTHQDLVTRDDWFVWSEEQLRLAGRVDLLGRDDPLATLVDFRVSIIEDISNSNNVAAGKRIGEKGLPSVVHPEVVNALKRGEPNAHHELAAEIGDRGLLGTWLSRNRVDPDTASDYLRAIDRNHPLDNLPIADEFWYGPGLADYVDLRLDPDAVLVPVIRSGNRQFWQETPLNVDYLTRRARQRYGGFTYDVITEVEPPRGWAVAIQENQLVVENFDQVTDAEFAEILLAYKAQNQQLLDQPDWYLGGWHDSDLNQFFLDTSRVLPDEVSSAEFGFRQNQLAHFDLEKQEGKSLLDLYTDVDEYILHEQPAVVTLREQVVDVLVPKTKGRTSIADDGSRIATPNLSLASIPKSRRIQFLEDLAKRQIYERDNPSRIIDSSQEAIERRLRAIIQRAKEEYESNPLLRDEHRFYERWNLGFREVATETGTPFERIAGGAAAMSPNLDADKNYDMAIYMARRLGNDEPLTQGEVRILKKYFKGVSADYLGYAEEADKEYLRLRKIDQSRVFREWGTELKVGDRLSQMPVEKATRVMHRLRQADNPEGVGFASVSFRQFVVAAAVMRGELLPIDGLGDTKVRSFFNNILDPLNLVGSGDVTVDFHMIDAALNASSISGKTYKGVSPQIDGLAWGNRAIIADIIRDLFNEGTGIAVDAQSPAELQEVIWHIWRLGKREKWWGEIPVVKERIIK